MLADKTNDNQTKAFEYDDQNLQDQYQVLQAGCLDLSEQFQTLYEQFKTLAECNPNRQGKKPGTSEFRHSLQDFHLSQLEHRKIIQQFRHTLHKHQFITSRSRSTRKVRIQAKRSLIRKVILLGEGNEDNASFLKESLQLISTHRVFLAADSRQAICLAKAVHVDLLVLDNELTPLPAIELYQQLHFIKGLETLPAIIISNDFNPRFQKELARFNLIGLEKPLKVEALIKAIDKLLVQEYI